MSERETVDGAALSLPEHAALVAQRLSLDAQQSATLVAELRNALVPALVSLQIGSVRGVEDAVERVLALATAVSRRS